MGSNRSRIVFVIVIAAAVIVVVASQLLSSTGSSDDKSSSADTKVIGYIGSEKADFLQNPQVKQILADRYDLVVEYTSLGSIAQATADTTGKDFLWPSSEIAQILYEETHASRAKAEVIFRSPLVLYSWPEVTDALIQQGIVTEENGVYYADMEQLVAITVSSDTLWKDIGLNVINSHQAKIISTDPLESNSGNMFYGLLANILVPEEVATDASVNAVLPTLKDYYDSLGILKRGSADLFSEYISTGMGAYPLIVNYENLLIEFTMQNPSSRDTILSQLRVIYPRPTVWSDHPLIALTPNGEMLMTAMLDPDLQKIAWEQHGFRSGVLGINNNISVLQTVNMPENINNVVSLPRPSVMSKIITALQ